MRLQDKIILITGASRGVGAACAIACAKEGANVVLAAKTVEPHPKLPGTLGEVAKEVEALGREALVLPTDVRDPDAVTRMVDTAARHFGRLDAVVNNAGAIFFGPVADHPLKRADLVHQVNFRAAFLVSQAAIPHMREHGGHIIMMSPPVITKAAGGKAPYLVSKLGMTILAEGIDAEEERIAAHALWPVTAIRTAATINFNMVSDGDWRTPAILADATVSLLAQNPAECSFRAWLDEEVLAGDGITDFTNYRVDPEVVPAPWSMRMLDPDWTR